jgi:putative flippase GtrA
MKDIKMLYLKYKEIIMYLIMGVLTTAVNWCVYAIMEGLLNFSVTFSNITAWVAGVLFAYITNKIFVFESYNFAPAFLAKELFLFVSARLITGIIEMAGVPALVYIGFDYPILGITGMLAKIIVSVIVVILNYVFSKLLIFNKATKEA